MSFFAAPTLQNEAVRLEQLSFDHAADLAEAVQPGELWKIWYTSIPAPGEMAAEIERRLALQQAESIAAWAIIDRTTNKAVGMTTYLNLAAADRRLEIGSTWIGKAVQGTKVNPAAKLLLLGRAFEDLGCIAVEFRTHSHNHQSRAAIARLGAKQDGVLRNHKILPNGTVRDTVVFSVIEGEWNTVKFGLQERLAR